MNKPKTPQLPCVTVSTAETPVYNRSFITPLDVGEKEREALRFLVKECGWYWLSVGVLRRHRYIHIEEAA